MEEKTYRKDDEDEAPDAKGATEDELQKIEEIKGSEVLGYEGAGREEHSGQEEPEEPEHPGLADNQDRVPTKESPS